MGTYKEIKGNLITLAKEGKFDIIGHGCNCFCIMGRGIAPQIAAAFPAAQLADNKTMKGDITKLGSYTHSWHEIADTELCVINIYSQFHFTQPSPYGFPLDYDALTLSLRKINHNYEGFHIGLPQIGAGLAGGDWERIKKIIQTELKDMNITIVIYEE